MKGNRLQKSLFLIVLALAGLVLAACGQPETVTPAGSSAGLVGASGQITPANTIAPGATATPNDAPRPANERVIIGAVAPDFSLTTPDNQTVKLSQFRGKPVLINFWATWCEPCRVELPLLVQTYQANQERLVILGINMKEDAGTVAAKVKEVGIKYPVVLDNNSDVTNRYQVRGYPTSLFVDKNGVIQRITVGQLTEDSLKASLERVYSIK